MKPAPASLDRRAAVAGVALVVLLGAILRLAGMGSELWFDEIVTVRTAAGFRSAVDVFTTAHTDNKHHLISLWIFLTGPGRPAWVYRLPSFAAGVAVLPLIWITARRWTGPAGGWIALLLATFCGPLIAYSSEARGYSLAVFFAVCSLLVTPDKVTKPTLRQVAAFATIALLGFLSSLTFAFVYGGLLVWSITQSTRAGRRWWWPLLPHVPVVAGLALLYVFDISSMTYAGGQATSVMDVARWTADHVIGNRPAAVVMAATAGILGFWRLARLKGVGPLLCFVTTLLLLPAAATATRRTPFLAGRYFLVCYPFAILIASLALTALGKSLPARLVAIAFLSPVVWTGCVQSIRLHDLGRGSARDAIARMTADGPATYDAERPVMDSVVIDYYRGQSPLTRQPADAPAPYPAPYPDWWILDLDDPTQIGPDELVRRGHRYRLQAAYPAEPGSGLTWDLYRIPDPGPTVR